MKYLVLIFVLPFVVVVQNCEEKSQSEKPILENHKNINITAIYKSTDSLYQYIKSQLKRYKKVSKELSESSEGGEVTGYFNNGKLMLIQVENCGDIGKTSTEYFFHNKEANYIIDIERQYNMPFYMEGSKVEKEIKNRFYLANNKLLKWINDKGKVVADSNYAKQMDLINSHIYNYSNILKSNS